MLLQFHNNYTVSLGLVTPILFTKVTLCGVNTVPLTLSFLHKSIGIYILLQSAFKNIVETQQEEEAKLNKAILYRDKETPLL
jgi:hypothetical protein